MLAYQYPVQLEVDDSMTALVRVLEPLLAAGAARQDGADTLILSS